MKEYVLRGEYSVCDVREEDVEEATALITLCFD